MYLEICEIFLFKSLPCSFSRHFTRCSMYINIPKRPHSGEKQILITSKAFLVHTGQHSNQQFLSVLLKSKNSDENSKRRVPNQIAKSKA